MSGDVITLSEVLQAIHSGAVCSLTYVTADRKRGTGGQLRHLDKAVLCKLSDMPANVLRRNGISAPMLSDARRYANHHEHKTRNMYLPATQEIRKVHIKLITQFNNKTVIL